MEENRNSNNFNSNVIYESNKKQYIKYIIGKLNLQKYDKMIKDSEYCFKEIKSDKMDSYQLSSKLYLRYFYIRNNINLDALSEEEFAMLTHYSINNTNFNDKKLIDFLEKTYKKVIFEDIYKNGQKCKAFYGPETTAFMAGNDSVVIGFRYDEYDESLSDSEWDEQHSLQNRYLHDTICQMNNDFNNVIDIPVSIIKYDDYSINAIENSMTQNNGMAR